MRTLQGTRLRWLRGSRAAAQAGLSGELSEGGRGLILPLPVTQQAPGALDSPPLHCWSTCVSTPPGTRPDLHLGQGGLSSLSSHS